MNFVIRLPVYSNRKSKTYNSILVIIDQLIKMVYYKLVKVIIHASGLIGLILDMVVRHHRLLNSIIGDKDSVFT